MHKKRRVKSCHTIFRQIFQCGRKTDTSETGLHDRLLRKPTKAEVKGGTNGNIEKRYDIGDTERQAALRVISGEASDVESSVDGEKPSEKDQPIRWRSTSSSEKKLLFTWMLAFRLPSAVTHEEQQAFERKIEKECFLHKKHKDRELARQGKKRDENTREIHFTSLDLVHKGFENFVEWHVVEDMMLCELTYFAHEASVEKLQRFHVPTNWPMLHGHVVQHIADKPSNDRILPPSSDRTYGEPPDSFQRAIQSSIELTLAFFADLERSLSLAISNSEESSTRPEQCVCVFSFTSHTKDALYMCVRLERQVAEHLADVAEYPVQLDKEGVKSLGINLDFSATSPAYVKYDSEFRNKCRMEGDSFQTEELTVLRPIDHIRLLYDKMTDYIDLSYLRSMGILTDSFPLHHIDQVNELRRTWGDFRLLLKLDQPLDSIRNYFGEEITFYFAFLQHLIKGLVCLSVPALVCSFWVYIIDDGSHAGIGNLVMSVIIMLWYLCWQKSWQRREAHLANEWGLAEHAVSTVKRLRNTEFDGELLPNPENLKTKSLQVARSTELIWRGVSLLLTSLFVVLMIALNAVEWCLYYWFIQPIYSDSKSRLVGQIISAAIGCFSGVQIKVVDSIWDQMSHWITNLECQSFDDEFNWSKSIKTSVVRFINTVSMMFFFGFVSPVAESFSCGSHRECAEVRRMNRSYVSMKLTTTFITRFFLVTTLNDIVKPEFHLFLRLRRAKLKGSREGQNETVFTEKQANMDAYGSTELTNDYLDVMLPFSFVVLFGMISPLTVVGCLLICLALVRLGSWKLLHLFQRPFPRLVKDIGSFNGMLAGIGNLMILSNLGLLFIDCNLLEILFRALGFSSEVNYDYRWSSIAFFFTLGFLILTLLWHFMDFVVSDTSKFLQLEMRRQNMQRHCLFFSAGGGPHEVKKRDCVLKNEFLNNRVDFAHCSPLAWDGNHDSTPGLVSKLSRLF